MDTSYKDDSDRLRALAAWEQAMVAPIDTRTKLDKELDEIKNRIMKLEKDIGFIICHLATVGLAK